MKPSNAKPVDSGTLSGHLWEAANILRGPVDAADFKTYIFPLLFFKRLSNVYDEEVAVALEESGGDMTFAHFPENHRFQVLEDCHWQDVRARSANIGHALQQAMRGIEQANPDTLHGIFGDAQWTNKERLADALLKDWIEHFSALSLGNAQCQADILGQAYEYLIKKFADLTNKKAGEFYTPRSVVALMVRILAPAAGETIYDPACGTGGMLLEALYYVKAHGGDEHTMLGKLYGQEKNLTTSAIARMNLFLHGAEDFHIERGDTLRLPAFYAGDSLATFDCVIANPPFSLEKWGEDVWLNDPYGRNFAGLPPAQSGDFAWVQHMLTSMAPGTGRMAVVLPHGVLFRMSSAQGDQDGGNYPCVMSYKPPQYGVRETGTRVRSRRRGKIPAVSQTGSGRGLSPGMWSPTPGTNLTYGHTAPLTQRSPRPTVSRGGDPRAPGSTPVPSICGAA